MNTTISYLLQFGSWAVAIVNLIGLIVVWVNNSKKEKKIKKLEELAKNLKAQNTTLLTGFSDIRRELGIGTETKLYAKKVEIIELKQQVEQFKRQTIALEKNNKIILQQGKYLRNIDRPLLNVKSTGYLITLNGDDYIYDYVIRLMNFGRRSAVNIKIEIITIEQNAKTGEFIILDIFKNEFSNPMTQNVDTKIGQIIKKEKNENLVFSYVQYNYADILDNKVYNEELCYKMPLISINDEKGIVHASINEKSNIINFLHSTIS